MPPEVTCPSCEDAVDAPAELAGTEVFCPTCGGRMRLPEQFGRGGAPGAPGSGRSPTANLQRRRAREPDHWAPERAAFNMGMLGGLGMMAIAAVWFFVGLAAGIIYFYPPLLFLIGLVGLANGAMQGNVAGRRFAPRRRRRR